ncbi:DUF2785 domain-containing protein [Xylocopilactobacillus apicola]|uniref:DUF2785 domain-containing protein n=1 Tax=Xylocopilactobacillus apicola TaxID=2932184 RepID=A0AAU9DP78_9LACO|nr:DUF2785 domain-containing protein [Xylocopilactobacillus apicola]BDR58932.1 hypothetical protein XA3_13730 [Xylocopilactobacillus apicola]
MQNELKNYLSLPDPLTFSNQQVEWLIDHLGDLDGNIRDRLTYTLMGRGFMAHVFTMEQKQYITHTVIDENLLFKDIDKPQNDQVFLRTFIALLGALILESDAEEEFLSSNDRNTWFNWAIEYLKLENDWRGFIPGNGWAHAVAHGSDLLASAVSHPDFFRFDDALEVVKNVLRRITDGFKDDEEERLAMVIISAYDKLALQDLKSYLLETDQEIWNHNSGSNADYYCKTTWKRILTTIYFLQPQTKDLCYPLIMKHYHCLHPTN